MACKQKIVWAAMIAMRRFPHAYAEQTLRKFRSLLTTSIDRGIDIDRIDVGKSIWFNKGEINGAQAKFIRSPKIAMRRCPYANI